MNSAQDRTILYDLLPLKGGGFRGYDIRLSLIAVPGQSMDAASRRVALRAADGVVFVANSAADRWEENIQSHRGDGPAPAVTDDRPRHDPVGVAIQQATCPR